MSARYYEAVGRRKTSSARVRLYPGTGTIVVNERPVSEYFPRETDQLLISRPLQTSDTVSSFNISIRVEGGGLTGQAGAAALGIARALCVADENLRPVLQMASWCTIRRAKEPQEVRSEARPQGPAVHEALVHLAARLRSQKLDTRGQPQGRHAVSGFSCFQRK